MNNLAISVVICAYNEQDWIGQTLDSLLGQKRQADEIVVINNASTDGTAGTVQRFIIDHPGHNIMLRHEVRKGLHHAREAGWRAANGNIIAMTDADITFPANWLEIVEDTFNNNQVDAITGIVRYHNHPLINLITWACDQLFQPERIGRLITTQYILTGGNSAYRRAVIEKIGGYVEKPQGMLEDVFLSTKLQEQSFHIMFVRNLLVWHSFRRYEKYGWRGYYKYVFGWSPENVWPDHLSDR